MKRGAHLRKCPSTDESSVIDDARAAILAQTNKDKFDPVPYQYATELLESLPSAPFVDERVQLALDITVATRDDIRPDLSRRALYAAFPAGSDLKNLSLKRKWFTFTAAIETCLGNISRALKYKIIALDLCELTKDQIGFFAEWINLANLAAGAGLYEDAIRYTTVALDIDGARNADWLPGRGLALVDRANALMRLGRFAEAEADLQSSMMLVTHPTTTAVRVRVVMAQYLFAEIRYEYGDRHGAVAALHAASSWADALDIDVYKVEIERVRARLSVLDHGLDQAISKLQLLLEEAQHIELRVGRAAFEDVYLDVLHTLECVCREHADATAADKWLTEIGRRLRTNAITMLDAVADNPILASGLPIEEKIAEVDRYLESRSAVAPRLPFNATSPWMYVVGLAASSGSFEDSSKEHGVRVGRLATLVGQELSLNVAMQRGIEAGCLVHDIGKVAVPPSVILKQTPLDVPEKTLYDAHASVGAELLERVSFPQRQTVLNVVRFHHHQYDGGAISSSPNRENIPIEARIAAVCDRYDALVTGRPRRPAVSSAEALQEIFEQRARDFDPNIVDTFIEVVRRLQRTHSDIQAHLAEHAEDIEYFAIQRTLKKAADRALTNPPATWL